MSAFLVVGDPALNRVRFFLRAARAEGVDVEVLPYAHILRGGDDWPALLAGKRVRLETPGTDHATELALLRRGHAIDVEAQFSSVDPATLDGRPRDIGRIHATRQWYLGWRDLLGEIARAGANARATFLSQPAEIAVMFDKPACHALLRSEGVPVPEAISPPASFDELMASLRSVKWTRAFLKTSHGSGANGVVALAIDGNRIHAHTALEVAVVGGEVRLYSTRRLRVYEELTVVRRLIDALCRERLHVEAWVPKAGIEKRTADARVVVIAGRACHLVLRLARGPITNLHLGSTKADEDALLRAGGSEAVALLRTTAEKAAQCFPGSACVGVDVAFTPQFRKALVLEVNAFGDLLEGVTWRGADTYTWQVRAALQRNWPPTEALPQIHVAQ